MLEYSSHSTCPPLEAYRSPQTALVHSDRHRDIFCPFRVAYKSKFGFSEGSRGKISSQLRVSDRLVRTTSL